DIAPDPGNDILQIRIHSLANPRNNIAVEHLLNHLNQTEFNYPGTTLRMIFSLNATTPPNPKR
ncbi:MAG: hypothetical protein JXR76_03755, partial [Deltaproteobacteria bacterium]|nr:hypothetical protein [Deltaproteobacteria bacterium]